jgi:hypothetical protein
LEKDEESLLQELAVESLNTMAEESSYFMDYRDMLVRCAFTVKPILAVAIKRDPRPVPV